MRDNVRVSGSVTLTVHLGLGRSCSIPVKTTDEAEEIVRKIAAGDPGLPFLVRGRTCPITYTVRAEEYFILSEGEDDDDIPF